MNVIVKHYAPTSFFLAAGFLALLVALSRAPRDKGWWPLLIAGVCLGAAAAIRVNAWLVILIVWALIPVWVAHRRKSLLPYALGLALPTAFVAAHAVRDLPAFIMDTFKVHTSSRDVGSFLGTVYDHTILVPRLLLDPQILVLLLASLVVVLGFLVRRVEGEETDSSSDRLRLRQSQVIAATFALAIFLSYALLPGALSGQYLNSVIPFMAFLAATMVANPTPTLRSVIVGQPLITVGLGIYVVYFMIAQLVPYLSDGRREGSGPRTEVRSDAPLRGLIENRQVAWEEIEEVALNICHVTAPDTRIASMDPMFNYLSGRPSVPGFEMGEWSWSFAQGQQLTIEEMDRFHLLGKEGLYSRMDGAEVGAALLIPGMEEVAAGTDNYQKVWWELYMSNALAQSSDVGKGCRE